MITLLEVTQQLCDSKTLEALNQVLKAYLENRGFSMYSFSYYTQHPKSKNKLHYDLASKKFERWHQHYIEEDYQTIDSLIETIYRGTLPTYWSTEEQLKVARGEKERQMRLDARAFGAECGLSIPIHGAHENFAILLVVQMRGERNLHDWKNAQFELSTVAHYYFSLLQEQFLLEQEPNQKYELSQREMQCLLLLAEKYSVQDTAEKLNITPRTVNFHMQQINKKLGTRNKYQSLAKAIEEKILIL
jgi:DNA-binding CsgD family transcriptional regulator